MCQNENYMKPAIAQKYVEVEVFNVEAIENIKTEIANLEIHDKLDKTLNNNSNNNNNNNNNNLYSYSKYT